MGGWATPRQRPPERLGGKSGACPQKILLLKNGTQSKRGRKKLQTSQKSSRPLSEDTKKKTSTHPAKETGPVECVGKEAARRGVSWKGGHAKGKNKKIQAPPKKVILSGRNLGFERADGTQTTLSWSADVGIKAVPKTDPDPNGRRAREVLCSFLGKK